MEKEVIDLMVWEIPEEEIPRQLALIELLAKVDKKKPYQQRHQELADIYKGLHQSLRVVCFGAPCLERVAYRGKVSYEIGNSLEDYSEAFYRRLQED